LLNDQWVLEEIRLEIKSLLDVNEHENTTYQNVWDTAKAILKGKFIAMHAYIKWTERSQINDLMLHLKLLEKEEQAKPKTNRKREIIKIWAEINEIETKQNKKTTRRIKETKSWFFEKVNKIDNPLANLTKMRREKTQISKIRNKRGVITINTKEFQGLIREYFEKLYCNKLENLKEMDKFLDTHDNPKLNQEDICHLNRTQIGKEVTTIPINRCMILYLKDPKNSTPKLLNTINSFSNVVEYKINLQKSAASLYTNND
jgi:hypothetical protein